tara:strand:- start:58 stop:2052 length:1995 start_codon:yes stop_codon:yes gene_type:complete
MKNVLTILILLSFITTTAEVKNQFATLPDIYSVKISPDGKSIGILRKIDGERMLSILDIQTNEVIFNHEFVRGDEINSFYWASEDRLIFELLRAGRDTTRYFATGQVYSTDIDGKKQIMLAGYNAKREAVRTGQGSAKRPAQVANMLPYDEEHIVVQFYDSSEFFELWKMNIYNGRMSKITTAPVKQANFIFNNQGEVTGAVGMTLQNEMVYYIYKENLPIEYDPLDCREENDDETCVRVRTSRPKVSDWEFLAKVDPFKAIYPISSFGRKIYMLGYGEGNKSDRRGLYTYDIISKKYNEIFTHPRVDIGLGAVAVDDANQVIGVRVDDAYPATVILKNVESDLKNAFMEIQKSYPYEQFFVTSSSEDKKKLIVFMTSDINPGTYFLYDRDQSKFTPLARSWSKIDYQGLNQMIAYDFYNRDGVSIQAFLTQAKNKSNKKTIIYPHGGPWARDYWGFEPTAQFLAENNFNVIQMNIRGSSGYGYEFGAEVFGNFEEVLEDIYDGIEFFDAEGLIDKNNLCIYGISYGGYAATMAPINRPDLFKCAASDAGLYDMEAQYKRGDIRRSRGGKVFLDRAFKGKDGKLDPSQSPINRVSEMRIPFFLLHGKKDIRTPYKDAELFMQEMDRNNIPYEKMIITKEEHGFSNEENREASMERLLKFFNKYL